MENMSRPRLIFVVFVITSMLLVAVHLRVASRRIFYKYRSAHVMGKRLKRELWRNQLQLERLKDSGLKYDFFDIEDK